MTIKGDAGFKFTDPSSVDQTFTLEAPLRDISTTENVLRFVSTSADFTARNVVTIGDGVDEIEATIRFETDVDNLKAMLRHGLNGIELTYYPSLAVTGTNYPCHLVAVNGQDRVPELAPDRDMWWDSRYECRIRLRRTDGGTFDALLEP